MDGHERRGEAVEKMEQAIRKILVLNRIPDSMAEEIVEAVRKSGAAMEMGAGSAKKAARAYLEKYSSFFSGLPEHDGKGLVLGYDEEVRYTMPRGVKEEEERQFIEMALQKVFRERMSSFLMGVRDRDVILLIKYRGYEEVYCESEVGPQVNVNNIEYRGDASAEELVWFKALWGEKVEYRKFVDSSIRACVSFKNIPRHAVPLVLLGKIFTLVCANGQIGSNTDWSVLGAEKRLCVQRSARVSMPVFSIEETEKTYYRHNRKGAGDEVRRAFGGANETLAVRMLEYTLAGERSRGSRADSAGTDYLLAKVGRGYKWPVEDEQMMECAVKSLLCLVGKAMEKQRMKVCGVYGKENLLVEDRDGNTSVVLMVDEERESKKEKYAELGFKKDFDLFIKSVCEENAFFPLGCAAVKRFLKSHGIYPHYLCGEAVEILCYRASRGCKTPGSFFRFFLLGAVRERYLLDIRPGRHQGRVEASAEKEEERGIWVLHLSGTKKIPLPEDLVLRRANVHFKKVLEVLGKSPGINTNYTLDSILMRMHRPAQADYDYVLSHKSGAEFLRVVHDRADDGGYSENVVVERRSHEEAWVHTLRSLGAYVYYGGGTEPLMVKAKKGADLRLIENVSMLLSGMKYLKRHPRSGSDSR
jgi:Nrap protein domain 3